MQQQQQQQQQQSHHQDKKYRLISNTDYGIDYSKILGKGAYGEVYLGCNIKTQELIAAKLINKEILNKLANKQLIEREINLLARKDIKHDNILNCHDVFQDDKSYILFTEYCEGGDLAGLIKKRGKLSEEEATDILSQIINGYSFLRSINIIHRDLKPENIMISKGIYKIGDFGTARVLGEDDVRTSFIGSLLYMSPEMLDSNGQYNEKTDIWSIGIIFYQMLYGTLPWISRKEMKLYNEIKQKTQNFESVLPSDHYISPECKDLILRMLEYDTSKRISINEIASHKLFNPINSGQTSGAINDNIPSSSSSVQGNMMTSQITMTSSQVVKVKVVEDKKTGKMDEKKVIEKSIVMKPKQINTDKNEANKANIGVGVINETPSPSTNPKEDKKLISHPIDEAALLPRPKRVNKIKIVNRREFPKDDLNSSAEVKIADISLPSESSSPIHSNSNSSEAPVVNLMEIIERRNKYREELDAQVTFDARFIVYMEEIIATIRSIAMRANLPKESYGMFTFALAKACFVKYMTDIEPLVDRNLPPLKMSHIPKQDWDELAKTNDFKNLKSKIKDLVRDQKKLFYHYHDIIKKDFDTKKIKIGAFYDILNDKIDDMTSLRSFIQNMGRNIVDFLYQKFGSTATREMKFIVKMINCIKDLQKDKMEIFDIPLRNQEIENMKTADFASFIAKF